MANKVIVTSGILIGGSAIVGNVVASTAKGMAPVNGTTGRILLGTYGFVVLLSLLDLAGGGASKLAGALALTAALFVVLDQWGPILLHFTQSFQPPPPPPVTDTTPGQKGPR